MTPSQSPPNNQNSPSSDRTDGTAASGSRTALGVGVRVPPQDIEAEMFVLGAMALEHDCIADVIATQLAAQDFYQHDHQLIYDALLSLYDAHGKTVDFNLLRHELETRKQLEQVGGVDYLGTLGESVSSPANVDYYARVVRDKAMLRELISAAGEITTHAFDDAGQVADVLDQAEQRIFQVTERKIIGQAQVMRDIVHRVYEALEHRTGGITGQPTGFLELDEITSGLQAGEMIVIAARPSMGKTALGLNIAEHIGADNGIPVAVFSLEMAAQQLAERMLAGRSHIDSNALRRGMLSDSDTARLNQTADELSNAPIFVDDSPGLTPLELRAKARRLKAQHHIQLVVVDYLQLMHSPGSESRQQEVGTISRHLKALGRELEIPVVVMSQLNRGPEGREGHRPRMSDLRESGNIEQDADVVMLLHREDYFHSESDYENTNTADIIIAKQRNGPTGNVELTWCPHWTRFENLATNVPDPYGI